MTAQPKTDERGRVRFGRLTVLPSPVDRALAALGEAVPALEAALGFPVSVTAQPRTHGILYVEVIVPDVHYSLNTARQVGRTLRAAVAPFTELEVEVDSDAPYAD